MSKNLRIGGTFAPAVTDAKLLEYQGLIEGMPAGPIKDACLTLFGAVAAWWEQPDSNGSNGSRPHPVGFGTIVNLDTPVKQALDSHLPWDHELEAIQRLLDTLPIWHKGSKEESTRNMAFHLLWHVKELCMDREPLTVDKIPFPN